HKRVGDLERLLAVVGLRDEQVLGLDAELAGVADVERVLRVDERADAAALLGFGDEVEREGGLARRLRAVDLDHPAARDPANSEREVEAERARGQRLDVLLGERVLAELHDRALAELLLDLADGQIDGPLAIHVDSHVTPSPAPGCRPRWPYSTPLSGASPVAPPPFFGARSGHSRAERQQLERLAERRRPSQGAAIEDDLGGRPGAEVQLATGLDGAGDRTESPWRAHPGKRHVAAERALLGCEAERLDGALARDGELTELGDAPLQPGPDHARPR